MPATMFHSGHINIGKSNHKKETANVFYTIEIIEY